MLACLAAAACMVVPAGGAFAGPGSEDELLRQIKSDVFEQKWDAVLAGCDQFIRSFTSSPSLPRAYYYRAQGLEHIKGREAEAIDAYAAFLKKFPSSPGTLAEDATLSRITMATSLYLKSDRRFVGVLTENMDARGYPRVYAAIQASKIDHNVARQKALPILKQCVQTEKDEELKNECVLAMLRIDPAALPVPTPPAAGRVDVTRPVPAAPKVKGGPPPPPPPPGAPGEAKLFRIEVFNKQNKQVSVRVNMPLAFAELALQSLGEAYGPMIEEQLKMKGLSGNLNQFIEALKKGGKQTLVEVETGEESIKIWVE
jgi:hypothetical protein